MASLVIICAQVFKDSQLMDKKLSVTDLDIIFSKAWLCCTSSLCCRASAGILTATSEA